LILRSVVLNELERLNQYRSRIESSASIEPQILKRKR
jgi:hypothetical protein